MYITWPHLLNLHSHRSSLVTGCHSLRTGPGAFLSSQWRRGLDAWGGTSFIPGHSSPCGWVTICAHRAPAQLAQRQLRRRRGTAGKTYMVFAPGSGFATPSLFPTFVIKSHPSMENWTGSWSLTYPSSAYIQQVLTSCQIGCVCFLGEPSKVADLMLSLECGSVRLLRVRTLSLRSQPLSLRELTALLMSNA